MGWWSAIWEIFKAVAPHAAPHVTQAVKDRWIAREAAERKERQAQEAQEAAESIHEVTEALIVLEQRMSAAEAKAAAFEEKASALEEKLAGAEAEAARNARNWATVRIWVIWLLVWNAAITAIMIYLIFRKK